MVDNDTARPLTKKKWLGPFQIVLLLLVKVLTLLALATCLYLADRAEKLHMHRF